MQVVEGETKFHIMTDEGKETHTLKAGMLVIVPQGLWHRFEAPDGVCLMTATPKPTEHLTVDVEDPRTLTAAQQSGATEEPQWPYQSRKPWPMNTASSAPAARNGAKGMWSFRDRIFVAMRRMPSIHTKLLWMTRTE